MERTDFSAFYDKFIKRIYKFVYFRVNGNKERAEDLTQDIFTKALIAFDRYDPSVSESAWIYTIARNHIINEAAKLRPQTELENVELEISQDWEHLAEAVYDEDRLLNAMKQLTADEADMVSMKYLQGWKYQEMAEIYGRSSGALRVQMTRTLKKLKQILKQK